MTDRSDRQRDRVVLEQRAAAHAPREAAVARQDLERGLGPVRRGGIVAARHLRRTGRWKRDDGAPEVPRALVGDDLFVLGATPAVVDQAGIDVDLAARAPLADVRAAETERA